MPKKERNSFDVLKEMSEKNMDIMVAPMGNVISVDVKGHNGEIKIGVPADVAMRFAKGDRFAGGLILANADQFEELSKQEAS